MLWLHTNRGKKNDAYVTCRVSDVFKRTTTIPEGGENPRWNGGEGEELLFEVDAAETAGRICFECKDDDSDEVVKKTGEIKEDDFIGTAVLILIPASSVLFCTHVLRYCPRSCKFLALRSNSSMPTLPFRRKLILKMHQLGGNGSLTISGSISRTRTGRRAASYT